MNREALAQVYDGHAAPLYRFLCGYLGNRDDAADALQNVFVNLARRGLQGIADIDDYLWTAARHEAHKQGRRRQAPFLVPSDGQAADPADRQAVESALLCLPGEQREVVILHVLEDLTFNEVGKRLGIPANTAASRFRYAKEKLKEVEV